MTVGIAGIDLPRDGLFSGTAGVLDAGQRWDGPGDGRRDLERRLDRILGPGWVGERGGGCSIFVHTEERKITS